MPQPLRQPGLLEKSRRKLIEIMPPVDPRMPPAAGVKFVVDVVLGERRIQRFGPGQREMDGVPSSRGGLAKS